MDDLAPTRRRPRLRRGVWVTMLLVACSALCASAWRWRLAENPAEQLDRAIREGSEAERITTLDSLWQYPQPQTRVLALTLCQLLHDPSPAIRSRAVAALGYAFQAAPEAIANVVPFAHLRGAALDESPSVRASAIFALGIIYERPDPWLPSLDSGPRKADAPGSVLAAVVAASDDPDASVRVAGVEAMGRHLLRSDETLARLVRATTDRDALVRARAVRRLGPWAGGVPDACRAVLTALGDRSSAVREEARSTRFNAKTAPIPVEAIPGLIRALGYREWAAYEFLAALGPKAREAAPTVALHAIPGTPLYDGPFSERALGVIAPESPLARAVVPRLIARFKAAKDPSTRAEERKTLASFLWDPSVVEALNEGGHARLEAEQARLKAEREEFARQMQDDPTPPGGSAGPPR